MSESIAKTDQTQSVATMEVDAFFHLRKKVKSYVMPDEDTVVDTAETLNFPLSSLNSTRCGQQHQTATDSIATPDSQFSLRQGDGAEFCQTRTARTASRYMSENASQQQSGGWRKALQRPPWTDEAAVRAHCTSCRACIEACPEDILFDGPAGTPLLDFKSGACTFCGSCATVCKEPVFRDTAQAPWTLVAALSDTCLLRNGVFCRSCTDTCDYDALHFNLRARPIGAITVDSESCTGCGACVSICPVDAVTLKSPAIKGIL